MSKKIIGIDLGTGFSCVSVMENGQPKVIFNSEGKATTPSVVSFAKDEIKVGQAALRQQVMYPKETVSFIKRFMGEKYDDVLDEVNRVQYKVVKGKNGLPCVDIDGKLYTPQEISAMILQKMKKTAEDYLGMEVTDAVITCPAYYGDDARTAVKNAGEIAGLNVRRIINEPTAAALSYGYTIDSDKEKIIVVADIGCGTADFTALEIGSGVVEVKSTNGDLHLGGVDFDNAIIDWVVEEFKKDNDGFDLSKDNMAMQRLAEAAEKAKIELSSTMTTEINLPYITAVNGMPVHFVKTLTRANFENMTNGLVKRIVDVCSECVKKANMDFTEIDDILQIVMDLQGTFMSFCEVLRFLGHIEQFLVAANQLIIALHIFGIALATLQGILDIIVALGLVTADGAFATVIVMRTCAAGSTAAAAGAGGVTAATLEVMAQGIACGLTALGAGGGNIAGGITVGVLAGGGASRL